MDLQADEPILDGEPNDVKSSDLREEDDKPQSHSSDGASAGYLSFDFSILSSVWLPRKSKRIKSQPNLGKKKNKKVVLILITTVNCVFFIIICF